MSPSPKPSNLTSSNASTSWIILTRGRLTRVSRSNTTIRGRRKNSSVCSIRLAVHGPDLFAKDVESDLYAAIDLVTKKIAQQIRKQHGRYKTHKHKDAAKLKSVRRSAGI